MEHFRGLTLLNENFTQADFDRARLYHRPLYVVRPAEVALGLAVPGACAVAQAGDRLSQAWWLETALLVALVVAGTTLVRLPLSAWRLRHERRWGFSTQSLGDWIVDRIKGLTIALVLTLVAMLGLVGAARAFPEWWPLAAGIGAMVLILMLTFAAPLALEPLFNRFRPLDDERLAGKLRALSVRAGVPVRDVLVSDASRRTRKHNAYVSGLGKTRRIVVWDTLLDRAEEDQLSVVVAHELAHRRFRHVAWGTLLGMAGAVVGVLALWALADDVADPGVVPFALFLFAALEVVALPLGAAISRSWERSADRYSLELTNDPAAYESLHFELARENLADLDPPRAYHIALHGHPTPPQRLAAGRAWKASRE